MPRSLPFFLLAFAAMLAACSSTPPDQAPPSQQAAAAPKAKECVQVTGSSICRSPDSGNPSLVNAVSGEAIRRSGSSMFGPRGEPIRD
jgi:hypothetical protein